MIRDIKYFVEEVAKKVSEKLGGVSVSTNEMIKNNSIHLTSVTIANEKGNLSPCIYMNQFFHRYSAGEMTIEEVICEVIHVYKENTVEDEFDSSLVLNYQKAKCMIRGRLINTERNQELLAMVPHREIMDLSLIYTIVLSFDRLGGMQSVRIDNRHIAYWGVSEEDLYQQLMENMRTSNEGVINSLSYVIQQMIGDMVNAVFPEGDINEECLMYVLSNKYRINGAMEMLNPVILKDFSEQMQKDLIILPSSIHECILMPVCEATEDIQRLQSMVKEVNDTQVPEEDILSYNVYLYKRETGEVSIAA